MPPNQTGARMTMTGNIQQQQKSFLPNDSEWEHDLDDPRSRTTSFQDDLNDDSNHSRRRKKNNNKNNKDSNSVGSGGSGSQQYWNDFMSSHYRDAAVVICSKLTVLIFLMIIMILASTLTYIFITRSQEAVFLADLESFADEIIGVSTINTMNIFSSILNMAVTITSYAQDTNKTWPFVTMPHFEQRGEQLLQLSGAKYVSLDVLVREEEKSDWEQYSVKHQSWVQDGLNVQGNGQIASPISPYITKRDVLFVPDEGPADPYYYSARWQITPAPEIPKLVNFNSMSTNFSQNILRMQEIQLGVLSRILDSGETSFNEIGSPQSYLSEPVFEELEASSNEQQQRRRTMVGFLNALLPWDSYFRNILPLGTPPLVLVLKNTCGQTLTYEINGPSVTLLSPTTDVHNAIFDDISYNAHFFDHEQFYLDHNNGGRRRQRRRRRNLQTSTTTKTTTTTRRRTQDENDDDETHNNNNHDGIAQMPADNNNNETMTTTNNTSDNNDNMDHTGDMMNHTTNDSIMDDTMGDDDAEDDNNNNMDHDDKDDNVNMDHDKDHGDDAMLHTPENHESMEIDPDRNYCWYEFDIYPTVELQESYQDKTAVQASLGVALIFLVTSAIFILHDYLVTKRQRRLEQQAAKSSAIVSSLFPAQVRDRLMEDAHHNNNNNNKNNNNHNDPKLGGGTDHISGGIMASSATGSVGGLQSQTLNSNHNNNRYSNEVQSHLNTQLLASKPIADLFPDCTVLFADICGFTAWSSVREPTQVFTLLEQVYNSFDVIAKRRRIFKVETIGDCYVAAAGLPDPRPDHAVAMARFASECLGKMHTVVKTLEVQLGPDTGDLSMRFGLHSGPVTAGVLRGEKSRFQLFGDTVNTASRIETTGMRGRIHLSESTATLIIDAGKASWVEKRAELVAAKGKGEIQTYWLSAGHYRKDAIHSGHMQASMFDVTAHEERKGENDGDGTNSSSNLSTEEDSFASTSSTDAREKRRKVAEESKRLDERKKRLVDWNVDVMLSFLRKIAAMRAHHQSTNGSDISTDSSAVDEALVASGGGQSGTTVLDEVKEIIALPQSEMVYHEDPTAVVLDPGVVAEVRNYVTMIASMYRPNAFHNFEHVSHVTQSVTKLLSRIVKADDIDYNDMKYKKTDQQQLHYYTFGITSDPITQFACAFSALIHDVDHVGVPNAQLVKEGTDLAKHYKNKSVAEQNSVDLAWGLLMEDQFKRLRGLIYTTQEELERFRQLVINCVMATDICDKELGQLRRARWDKAFYGDDIEEVSRTPRGGLKRENSMGTLMDEEAYDNVNRKATIVIEHLIQASDVAHTMQHWHVYTKWNEKLFQEMYKAYQDGRSDTDPSEGWYKGELGFFDFYVIPLAKKLKECGVFGVASDEYLNYAEANRKEWERKGESIVKKYLEKLEHDA